MRILVEDKMTVGELRLRLAAFLPDAEVVVESAPGHGLVRCRVVADDQEGTLFVAQIAERPVLVAMQGPQMPSAIAMPAEALAQGIKQARIGMAVPKRAMVIGLRLHVDFGRPLALRGIELTELEDT